MVLVQTSDPQTSDGTNLRLTNVRQNKRLTRTNVGLVQTSDNTNVGQNTRRTVQTSDQYKRRPKENKLLEFKDIFDKNLLNHIRFNINFLFQKMGCEALSINIYA